MGCGCNENVENIEDMDFVMEHHPKKKITKEIILRKEKGELHTVSRTNEYVEAYIDKRMEKVIEMLDDMLPYLCKISEQDEICLECCEKHLSKAQGYIDESKTDKYRLNIFRAIGQLGLAESHARMKPELADAIRDSRLQLQRTGDEPNWECILKIIDKDKDSS